jgi:hypothetical protein
MRALVVPQEPEPPVQAAKSAECDANCAHHRPVRPSWVKLLKRVFDLDLEHCPNCGGELKIIAAILEQPVIEKSLTHLGLQARAPPRAPARGQALQAEPGHKQSSGLFVPGEGSGHWPDAPCKGPDDCRFITVQVARRAGLRGSAAREGFRDRWMWRGAKGQHVDDARKDAFRPGRPRPTDFGLHPKAASSASGAAFRPGSAAFGVPSGRKRAFEKPVLLPAGDSQPPVPFGTAARPPTGYRPSMFKVI